MSTIWFISDTHFGHANIIKYCNRPFASADEMDEAMIERWNRVVKPQDHVYHLGDVLINKRSFPIIKRLNGHKRLVFGNHDIFEYQKYAEAGFQKMMGMRVYDGIIFTHVPVHTNSLGRFRANVHGHTHDNKVREARLLKWFAPNDPRYVCVCVEQTDYTPVSLEAIKARLS